MRYAGLGSRFTPPDTLALMHAIAARMALEGWVLRTGLSPGADQAFYAGAVEAGGAVELCLPFGGFESHVRAGGQRDGRVCVLERPSQLAYALAARFHPDWDRLDVDERALLARDAHEVLGADLESPVEFVICWTDCGSLDGRGVLSDGTGQALRIAHAHGIRVFNLALEDHARSARRRWLGGVERDDWPLSQRFL